MLIFGITGYKEHGKSTVGKFLRQQVNGAKSADLEFSDPIIDIANDWLQFLPSLHALHSKASPITMLNTWIELLTPVLAKVHDQPLVLQPLRIAEEDSQQTELDHYLLEFCSLVDAQNPVPITRENKAKFRSILIWLGELRQHIHPEFWSRMVAKRLQALEEECELVTIGGVRAKEEAQFIKAEGGIMIKIVDPRKPVKGDPAELRISEIVPDLHLVNNGLEAELEQAVARIFNQSRDGSLILTDRPITIKVCN